MITKIKLNITFIYIIAQKLHIIKIITFLLDEIPSIKNNIMHHGYVITHRTYQQYG